MDLAGEKERLQTALGACQQEVGACRQELEQVRVEHSQLTEKLQANHRAEKARLQQELEAGQRGQRSLQEELTAYQADSKKVSSLPRDPSAVRMLPCIEQSARAVLLVGWWLATLLPPFGALCA